MPFNFEEYAFFVVLVGLVLFLIGYLVLLRRCFGLGKFWGFLALIPPLPIVIGLFSPQPPRRPLLLMMVGLLIAGGPLAFNRLGAQFIDLGPWEKQVNGELHLTLTGWDRSDYSVLKSKSEAVVLQIANADVTDAILADVAAMQNLRELDLNGTQVTDAGLAQLTGLKKLEGVRLRGTKISDKGLAAFLEAMPSLKELDVRDTAVSAETIQEWRRAQPGRRANFDRPRPPPPASAPTATVPQDDER